MKRFKVKINESNVKKVSRQIDDANIARYTPSKKQLIFEMKDGKNWKKTARLLEEMQDDGLVDSFVVEEDDSAESVELDKIISAVDDIQQIIDDGGSVSEEEALDIIAAALEEEEEEEEEEELDEARRTINRDLRRPKRNYFKSNESKEQPKSLKQKLDERRKTR